MYRSWLYIHPLLVSEDPSEFSQQQLWPSDQKSIWLCLRRFKSYQLRKPFALCRVWVIKLCALHSRSDNSYCQEQYYVLRYLKWIQACGPNWSISLYEYCASTHIYCCLTFCLSHSCPHIYRSDSRPDHHLTTLVEVSSAYSSQTSLSMTSHLTHVMLPPSQINL